MSNNRKVTVRIDSILGGHSPMSNFSSEDQFRSSLNIDPSRPASDSTSNTYHQKASGLLRPNSFNNVSGSTMSDAPMWFISNPKLQNIYVLDHQGSTYSVSAVSPYTVTALSDGGSMSNSSGNGAVYYDNYIYFSKNTTVARYGPLDGTPAFDGDYWSTTLGKTALNNSTTYPTHSRLGYSYPTHILHRHSDGKVYILDVVGGRGSLSYISTTKTTTEGDTDNGSTYNKISFGQNFWPSAIASYGTNLVIALFEGSASVPDNNSKTRAKILIWDTTSQNYNSISNEEFPDQFVSAIKNINGTLYFVSGDLDSEGFRLSRYIGGNSIEEVAFFPTGSPCFAGAIGTLGNIPIFGSHTETPSSAACIYSYGLPNLKKDGLFCIGNVNDLSSATTTAVSGDVSKNMRLNILFAGTGNGSSGGTNNSVKVNTTVSADYSEHNSYWWSKMYSVGSPYKITKITIPLAQAVATGMTVVPKVYTDDGQSSTTLTTINNTNFSGKKRIVLRPEGLVGTNNFWIELKWSGATLCVVSLPITIEYELVDVDP